MTWRRDLSGQDDVPVIYAAAQSGHTDVVKQLMASRANVNATLKVERKRSSERSMMRADKNNWRLRGAWRGSGGSRSKRRAHV